MSHNVVGSISRHEVNDVVAAEVLLKQLHSTEYDAESLRSLDLCLRMKAVVAVMTVLLGIFLTEVVEQHLTTAHRRLGIDCRLLEQLTTDVLFGNRLALHELLEFLEVLIRIERYTLSLAAITSGTSRLLIIPLKTLRDVVMDDETHVGFVDTHTEGYRSHDDIDGLHEEIVLRLTACHAVKTCMIGSRLDVVGTQYGSQFLYLLS